MKLRFTKSTRSVWQGRQGLTLIELLVTICIIGIIAAIAIPSMSSINDNAAISTAQRNAQEIVTVFSSGQAAGATSFTSCTTEAQAVAAVGIGAYGSGNMAGTYFKVPGVSPTMDSTLPSAQQAASYLTWDSSTHSISYVKAGGQVNP